MNGEILWNALGEIGADLVTEAETPPVKVRKNPKLIFLAAAIIILLSACTYAAVKWAVSFEDIFGGEGNEIIKEDEQPLNFSTPSEEGEISLSLVSALADERIFYLLWQLDGGKERIIPTCLVSPDVYFSEGTVDNGLGYYTSQLHIDEVENGLTGYLVSQWNEEMQHSKGIVRIDDIFIPNSVVQESGPLDLPKIISQSEYIESEYKLREGFSHEYFAEYQWLDFFAYENTKVDLAVYEDGILTVVLRTKRGEASLKQFLLYGTDGFPLEIQASATFNDKNGYFFTTTEYKVAEKDLPYLYYQSKEITGREIWTEGSWSLDFDIKPTMSSTVLKTLSTDTEISCSKISMSIKGDLPEFESIEITLKNGEAVQLIDTDPACIIFQTPIEPEDIASVKYNGTELLG